MEVKHQQSAENIDVMKVIFDDNSETQDEK